VFVTKNFEISRGENLTGSFWMIAAMTAFAVEDLFIKVVSAKLPVAQILIMFGFGGAFIFACLAIFKRERLFSSAVISIPMRLRVLFEILGRLFYVLAITLTPLSSATVIL
jgi:drug/metabolite transporter (DMT)-like permease